MSDALRRTINFHTPREIELRLRLLGLKPELLDDVRIAWAAAEANTSPFEPTSAAGSKGWFAATGLLRERLVVQGWTAVDAENWPVVVAPDRKFAVCVTSGDPSTGQVSDDRQPTTRNPKGPFVGNVVNTRDDQLTQPYHSNRDTPQPIRKRATEIPQTWFLLTRTTESELWAELSLPGTFDGEWITRWQQRIILPVIKRGAGPVMRLRLDTFEDAPAPVVRVRRK